MAANIPGQIQQLQQVNTTSVPVTMVTTMPLGVPPLAQLSPSVQPANIIQQQQQQHSVPVPALVQNNLATNSMQVQSVVPATMPPPVAVTTAAQAKISHAPSAPTASMASSTATPLSHAAQAYNDSMLLSRTRLQDLVREVDSSEQLDDEVEDLLLQLADDFVESTVNAACLLAKHRKATTVEVKDVQLHLERNWNMWTPGFGTDELRPYKRAPVTEAHKQRLALIRKAIKKY